LLTYKLFLFVSQLHDRYYGLDIFSMLMIAGLYLYARRKGAFLSAAACVPAFLVASAAIVMPKILSGSALADYRVAPVAIILFFLSVRSGTGWRDGTAAAFALALVGIRLVVTATGWHQDAVAYQRHLEALRAIPMGARLLVLVPLEATNAYQQRPLGHLADIAVVRRDALVNSQWINTGAILLSIKTNADKTFYADPSQFIAPERTGGILAGVSKEHFDFAWVLGGHWAGTVPANLEQAYGDEETRLFRVKGLAPN